MGVEEINRVTVGASVSTLTREVFTGVKVSVAGLEAESVMVAPLSEMLVAVTMPLESLSPAATTYSKTSMGVPAPAT